MRGRAGRARTAATLVCAVAPLSALAGCGDTPPTATSTSVAPTATARPVDPAVCANKPPQGNVDRTGQNFEFHHGNIKVAISDAPAKSSGRTPAVTTPANGTRCYEFGRWGPADPDVPPDSLLFVFKGAGSDGAQIEFLISELTGGLLPPIGGTRPTVGPLSAPINAQIGVSVDGVYHHASACQLSISGMSGKLAAGSFTCPTAALVDANPFAPDDDVRYDADESSTTPPAATGVGAPEHVTLTGFFQLTP
ncbi:hypothetical protein GDN83_12950 [Gordonia jinghuaiqii]|uniref:Lipoprotein n=1 Tax=Gordonia jinghuaiqii TaxID=2758710 RepID=A0A7D7QJA5_9ACTN|nr:hypothetical protein [Gordonia jinghuaiqii]MCR5978625.1 hypothetical protein [Gordonia jinghuaiqii]QMT02944.1 hypothetical protein H1R19_07430 [Gordonia jinghuaiqii]